MKECWCVDDCWPTVVGIQREESFDESWLAFQQRSKEREPQIQSHTWLKKPPAKRKREGVHWSQSQRPDKTCQ